MNLPEIKSEEDIRNALAGWNRFGIEVYVATFKIPKGKISTYGRIAKRIGAPKSYRAVANALHKNPLHPVVPCHRVVKSDGGFGGDPERAAERRILVAKEGVPIEDGKVKMSEEILYE
ncbi:MAG: MGMT family protein [Candidatus Thorarchaeota archaeon]|nr:MGMT family protein [Candidatus Thorarchaeota archaeon]